MSGKELVQKSNNLAQFEAIEGFRKLINELPPAQFLEKTPDGRADSVCISYIEAKLDEIYLDQWGMEDETVQFFANEAIMSATLWVIHPVTGRKITRLGCAAIQIMVDKVPDNIKYDAKAKNTWALDMANKKPNALTLNFPKLRALTLKNAAKSLGNVFGRNLNRKLEDTPDESFYSNVFDGNEKLTVAIKELKSANTAEQFNDIWNKYPELQADEEFRKEFLYYKKINSYGNAK
jgi:hypothetical protein